MTACFFLNDTATTEIYTLSLHDALPIYGHRVSRRPPRRAIDPVSRLREAGRSDPDRHGRGRPRHPRRRHGRALRPADHEDRKSTRLNSSHANISYAVFCLKKKTKTTLV